MTDSEKASRVAFLHSEIDRLREEAAREFSVINAEASRIKAENDRLIRYYAGKTMEIRKEMEAMGIARMDWPV